MQPTVHRNGANATLKKKKKKKKRKSGVDRNCRHFLRSNEGAKKGKKWRKIKTAVVSYLFPYNLRHRHRRLKLCTLKLSREDNLHHHPLPLYFLNHFVLIRDSP